MFLAGFAWMLLSLVLVAIILRVTRTEPRPSESRVIREATDVLEREQR